MIRGIVIFLIVWVFVTVGLEIFNHLSLKEKMSLFKTLSYGFLTAAVSVVILVGIVTVF
jgi:hypothetical protein